MNLITKVEHDINIITLSTDVKILEVEAKLKQFPQCETMKVEHVFNAGMYIRKVWREAGTVIVGKVHKEPHFFMCMSGAIQVLHDNEVITLYPGDVVCSQPGTKRITVALVDSIGATVHKTELTDLDKIEEALIEEDDSAMYNAEGILKNPLLNEQKLKELI